MVNVVEKVQAGEKLPKGWKWVKLGDVCDTSTENRDPRLMPDLPFQYVDIASVDNASKRILDLKTLLGRDAPSRARQVIRTGNVIVSTTRPNLNAVALVPQELENQICSTGFCVLRPSKAIELSYLFNFVQSSEFVQNLSNLVKGALYPAVTDRQVLAQSIPLPPLPEQKRIVGILSDRLTAIDKARTATETQLKAAKALPAAYLRQVFDSAEAQKWKIKRLGDVLEDIVAGKSLKCDERPARLDEWGVLKVSAVSWGKFKPEQNKVLPEYFIPLSEHEVKAGDLLISRANTTELVGAVVLVEEGTRSLLMLSDKTLRLIPTTQADKGYLELALRERMAREYIEEHGTGTSDSMKNISQETIRNIPILLPPISKQIEIAEAQGKRQPEIERVIQILQSQLNTINQLSAATLRQAFNGEL